MLKSASSDTVLPVLSFVNTAFLSLSLPHPPIIGSLLDRPTAILLFFSNDSVETGNPNAHCHACKTACLLLVTGMGFQMNSGYT